MHPIYTTSYTVYNKLKGGQAGFSLAQVGLEFTMFLKVVLNL